MQASAVVFERDIVTQIKMLGGLPGVRLLLVSDDLETETAAGRAARALGRALEGLGADVVQATAVADARAIVRSDSSIQSVLLDWDLAEKGAQAAAREVLAEIRARNEILPIFLLADRSAASRIPLDVMQTADDFIWLLEDTPEFIAGRVIAAVRRYRIAIMPPMFGALARFAQTYEYSWHTPGHTGGTAFLKHPVGRAFFDYFGENLLRSDLSISVGELGSLLDHSGPIGEGERYAARVFGAHRTYTVTNGSSTSNRVILMASVTRDQVALCDRNCHKSAEHAMTMSGAIPTYLVPSRNRYGIIGPIFPERLSPKAVKQAVKANALVKTGVDPTPVHAIITNSTYDGLCYNVTRVEELLGAHVDRLHFDEAWYGYARFHPIYRDRHAMHGDPAKHDPKGPTVFATQSTHKLLAALSQASFIHVRDGRRPIEHGRFNEAFMMHASTSPQYAIIASNDVTAAMMDGPSGHALTSESIQEAVAFRQTVARLHAELSSKGEWFFQTWQPDRVRDGKRTLPVHEVPADRLASDPSCWVLRPNETWHGFGAIEDGYAMLDPIKVSVLTPGVATRGGLERIGLPAALLTAYLGQQGVVAEKTTDFSVLFLFSIGITKGKWGTLINALLDCKRDLDANAPLERVLPGLVAANPARYREMGFGDLAREMFGAMKELRTTEYLAAGFSTLPVPELSPVEAYERLVLNEVERVPVEQMSGRVVATGVVPYPPGIPLLMPGENAGPAKGPILGYLDSLLRFDARFPGFAHDTHGMEVEDGVGRVYCARRGKPR